MCATNILTKTGQISNNVDLVKMESFPMGSALEQWHYKVNNGSWNTWNIGSPVAFSLHLTQIITWSFRAKTST